MVVENFNISAADALSYNSAVLIKPSQHKFNVGLTYNSACGFTYTISAYRAIHYDVNRPSFTTRIGG